MIRVPLLLLLTSSLVLSGCSSLNRMLGGSTGTNLVAAFQIIAEMHKSGEEGSVVSIICDDGHRYLETYYNADWLAANEFNLTSYQEQLERFYLKGCL